jgi:Sap, sulfolipid-1-addressing protein
VHGLLPEILANGIGIAAAPWCIIGVILILSGPKPLLRASAFLLGAATTMVVIYGVCAAAIGRISLAAPESASSNVGWVKLVSGLVLLAFGIWRWRRPAKASSSPRWLGMIDRLTVVTSFLVGLLMPNPIFAAAGALDILKADVSPGAEAFWLLLLIVTSLSSMITPAVLYARAPVATAVRLARWKEWLALHSGAILTAMCVGYGALITLQALNALA